MAELTITHDHENGTRLTGSHKGDGVLEILQALAGVNWAWRHYAGVHIRGSRDKFAYRLDHDRAVKALQEAGHTVTVQVDDTWRPAAVRYEERGERAENRADRLDERAGKAQARSDAAHEQSREIAGRRPFGQPVLTDHYSAAGHRRDIARGDTLDRRSYQEADYADHLSSRAKGARSNEAAKHDPRAIMRKIETLQTDNRELERNMAPSLVDRAGGGTWPQDTTLRPWQRYALGLIERNREEIAHLEGALAEHADAGTFVAWGPAHFVKGDLANVGGKWCEVARINQKSVSVHGRWHHSTPGDRPVPVKWDEIHGRRRDGMQIDAPNGDPWPVELAKQVERWQYLTRLLRCNPHDDESRRQHMHIQWAPRIVHGLDLGAAFAELRAVYDAIPELGRRRELAAQYLAVYKRLEAGEPVKDIQASIEPVTVRAAWAIPAGREPELYRAGPGWPTTTHPLVGVGDLVGGYAEHDGAGKLRVIRSLTGPVESVSPVKSYGEGGDWVTIRLTTGDEAEMKVTRWLAVYPAGTWETTTDTEQSESISFGPR
jgi:hypothetical protein